MESRAFFRAGKVEFPGLKFLLFVLPDVNPVSLQLDLDRRFQLQDIMMDFKVCFLRMAVDGRGGPWAIWAWAYRKHSILVSLGLG